MILISIFFNNNNVYIKNNMMKPVYLAIIILLSYTRASIFQECASKSGNYTNITVSNCNESAPMCILKANTNTIITIKFFVSKECQNVTAIVHGIISETPIPFPLKNPDACKDNNFDCPLKPGTSYEYKANLPISKFYPKIKVTVKWELKDENKDNIVCVEIPAKIE